MSERASIFDSNPDFDVAGFVPKREGREGGMPPEILRAVSEASSFRSREPVPAEKPALKKQESFKREPRRYRTGRNVQLNIKVRSETLDSFYKIADREGWVLGETFEKAIAALDRELSTEENQKAL